MGQIVAINGRLHDLDHEPSLRVGSPPLWRTTPILNSRELHDITINGYDYPPCPSGAVLYYPGLPGQGSTIWDRSSYANHGTITGAAWVRTAQGLWNLYYDGIDDFLNIDAVVGELAGTTIGTISQWVQVPAIDNEVIFAFGDTDAATMLVCTFTAGKFRIGLYITAAYAWDVTCDDVLSIGTHHKLTVVQNGTEPVLYVDGAQPAQTFTDSTDKTKWFADAGGIDNGRVACNNFNGAGNDLFLRAYIGMHQITTAVRSLVTESILYRLERSLFGV